MEIQATTTSSANGTTTNAAGQKSGKADGGKSPFGTLLQTLGGQALDADKKQGTDPLATLLAALAGGFNPLALQQTPTVLTGDGPKETAPVGNALLDINTLSVQVNGLSLLNGDLAALLQNFGASARLLGVLQEHPDQQLAQTLAGHPELLNDFGQALTNLVTQVTQNPQQLALSPKAATLVEALFAQLLQPEGTQEPAASSETQDVPGAGTHKQPLFGKLQATTLTAHSLQVLSTSTQVDTTTAQLTGTQMQASVLTAALLASDQPVQQQAQAGDTLDGSQLLGNPLTGGQTPLQSARADQLAKMKPVVTLHADNFNKEFANLVVKRAALIEAPGRHEFRIVMQPQGLGEIEVRVQAIGNQITMHLSADSAATKGLLDSNLSSLKSQLQAQGIQFDRIEVSSTNTGNNNQNSSLNSGLPHDRQSGQNSQGQSGNQSNRKRSDEERFSLDGIDALTTANDPQPEEIDSDASIDVTA
ncbi:flagellar hook-length control protein FliK [Tumebacillus permanentifrigoris]|uniref:Flagellar hook-length control protein FliK n=1 Tax=Tumebacillus permanentifrigoris TaxID=378543 RepID=A0A316D7K5_9BACL|nr:flagellar hook-length control protein FliK [Tumebacillus permanentifrigoris]PWK12709.1 flagellar hook-length control protein FliK [Tumebacillus permanentifrigoris]